MFHLLAMIYESAPPGVGCARADRTGAIVSPHTPRLHTAPDPRRSAMRLSPSV